MGTGSGGGGGSGAGAGGSGSGGVGSGAGFGGYRFIRGEDGEKRIAGVTGEAEPIRVSIQRVLHGIPKTYLRKQFGSPLVGRIFRELCSFDQSMDPANPCESLASEYGIEVGQGFLVQWINRLMDAFQHEELNSKMRATARMTAEDFLISALGDDLELYVLGTCQETVPRLDRRIFDRTSEYFLGHMIWRVIEREYERQPVDVQERMKEECRGLAERIVEDFEGRFVEAGEATDCDLFDVIQEQMDWFVQKLRERIERE